LRAVMGSSQLFRRSRAWGLRSGEVSEGVSVVGRVSVFAEGCLACV